ncbi:MOLPALP family lipoprotein [Mycoplasma capricolum subsp. capripneumoniae]|uniref:MOLPALP family lipoprotein n=1 Tax=Mycoplasma capricolum TaxID=2095 RepID=UPI0014052529|nr:MOLPALP family lipoprotein [Mycoplasma capricolum]QIN42330.1 MOLPALP family lipoprotein [Mycoplasma capricolum subsp. capripneumoniae]QIN45759.1 MOLPALP family lipoprotein [Mycoplasma capricolum subsp. capripneumoniae]QIN47826.1 MOLPALP family lipoprotein [Mycoplasma capricolum subsp. capripneumoniae]
MNKLIAILSSMMMITTASLPVIACHKKQKEEKEIKFENNNSITNAHSTVSLFAKELILADQLKVQLSEIKNKNNKKSLSDLLKENNLTLENTDKRISNINTFENLLNQYFEKDSYKKVLDSKIKLDLKNNSSNFLFKEIFQLVGLGEAELNNFSDDITKLLNLTISLNPMFVFANFKEVDSALNTFFEKLKPTFSNWIKTLSTPKEGLAKSIKAFQDEIDVNKKYKDLKAEDLDVAFYVSLVNAIGLALSTKDFKEVELKTNNVFDSLKNAGDALNKILSSSAQPNKVNGSKVVSYVLQALQFLQLKLSLFENARDHKPTSADKLFDNTKQNQQFIKDLYKDQNIESISKKKPSFINLKYLLSFFKKPVEELKDKNQKDGYELQKLLAMLFLTADEVTYKKYNSTNEFIEDSKKFVEENKSSPLFYLLQRVLENQLNNKFESKKDKISTLTKSLPILTKWLTLTVNDLLNGKSLAKSFNEIFKENQIFQTTLEKLFESEIIDKNVIPADLHSFIPFLPALVNSFLFSFLTQGDQLSSLIKEVIPVVEFKLDSKQNAFKEIYSGSIFDINKVKTFINNLKGFLDNIAKKPDGAIFAEASKQFNTKVATEQAEKFLIKPFNELFGNVKTFNLKTLLTTPLNKMDESKWKDRRFAKPLQSKSVADILDTLLTTLNVQGNEKLESLESSNINLTALTEVVSLINNYSYKAKGVNSSKTQLIELLKENPDKALQILGWISDKNNPIGKGSLLDTLLSKVFNFKMDDKKNKTENALNQFAKVTSLLNKWLVTQLNESDLLITFSFTNTNKNSSNQLLSETMIATVKNKVNNSQTKYTFSYARDKQSKFKFTKISKN